MIKDIEFMLFSNNFNNHLRKNDIRNNIMLIIL